MKKAPLKIDDVRSAIADNDIDVNKTNANLIRKLLGHGSMGTVQKHLDTIRAEIADANKPKPEALAITPDDNALRSIWDSVAALVHQKALETINGLHVSKAAIMDENNEMRDCLIQAKERRAEDEKTITALEKANEELKANVETYKIELSARNAKLEEAHKMIEVVSKQIKEG